MKTALISMGLAALLAIPLTGMVGAVFMTFPSASDPLFAMWTLFLPPASAVVAFFLASGFAATPERWLGPTTIVAWVLIACAAVGVTLPFAAVAFGFDIAESTFCNLTALAICVVLPAAVGATVHVLRADPASALMKGRHVALVTVLCLVAAFGLSRHSVARHREWYQSSVIDDIAVSASGRIYTATWSGFYAADPDATQWTLLSVSRKGRYFGAVAASPEDPDHIWAATERGLWESRDGGAKWTKASGVSVDAAPENQPISVAGHGIYVIGVDGLLHVRRSSSDEDWEQRPLPYDNTTHIAASLTEPALAFAGCRWCGALFRSRDYGETWEEIQLAADAEAEQGGILAIAFVPGAAEAVIVATTDCLYLSLDSGETWQRPEGLNCYPADDAFLAVGPGSPGAIYQATQSGILKSADLCKTWERLPLKDVDEEWAFIQCIAVDPQAPDRVYLGTTEGLYLSRDGGLTWQSARLTPTFPRVRRNLYPAPQAPSSVH